MYTCNDVLFHLVWYNDFCCRNTGVLMLYFCLRLLLLSSRPGNTGKYPPSPHYLSTLQVWRWIILGVPLPLAPSRHSILLCDLGGAALA